MHLSRPRRGPWKDLVLVASLLAYGISQASSQISINSFIGFQGYPSFLQLNNVPEGAREYIWHRGTNDNAENVIISYKPPSNSWQPGPLFSGRENVTHTGTLQIENSTLSHTGNYTVRVDLGSGTQRATGWLEIQVLEGDPVLSVNTSSVAENMDSVVAFCSTNATKIVWYVNYLRVSSNDKMTISPDGKTLIMHWVHRNDMTIQCGVHSSFGEFLKSEVIFLTVAYGPDRVALSSKPSEFRGILSAEIGSQVQMDCTSTSKPAPKYRWIHNGSFLSSEAKLSFPSLTWEQMGRYRCIVENSVTQMTMYKDIWIQRAWQMPVIRTGFYMTGPLVVFFIVMTVLGGVYICGILVYMLINRSSTRTSRGL
ncbi:carcinoembryonic antigen-related cell adhesion molecule 18 [Phyllostomus hastatus]|uniref:carcinoembryonic antigen-related cell adhesion molecule 18 n=1 Tax=Phyllostomus hastatus TaxID=9423 RepID=UPI001E681D00|nr:carcinoembryonic antigen-related cell adhesion molecule 18 [Phyllostomus hastatus]